MSTPFSRAPHIEGARAPSRSPRAPNAALLIDFDNVTMGMRSDLSKELKTLLASDIIKGKVTVQRAYADWRRYPQYIVPLSEASVDLIFAPAYGSNKKNATDIRMAIDGIELVFTRPEIGTYILLTGDSDFSSLVLKLKEYGKYVIGVGLQESSSDILVQNCDEYYSYTSLSGLRKADEGFGVPLDPWRLVQQAAEQMARRGDVMRSDRLKQVMLDIDATFDEKGFGFNKFSRFVSEASKKGLIEIRKMENGQYEILSVKKGRKMEDQTETPSARDGKPSTRDGKKRGAQAGRDRGRRVTAEAEVSEVPSPPSGRESREPAYSLLREAVSELLGEAAGGSVRDSDVKRRMLALQHGFSETDLGFPKFSRFLQQAHDDGVVELQKTEGGNYQVALGSAVRTSGDGSDAENSEPAGGVVDPEKLRLPTGRESVVKYLTNSYGGVGKRTAETLVDALGDQLFQVLHTEPSRVEQILPPARAERVLAGWRADFERRSARMSRDRVQEEIPTAAVATEEATPGAASTSEPRRRRGRRTRGGSARRSEG